MKTTCLKFVLFAAIGLTAAAASADVLSQPGTPTLGSRHATDAFPGFDSESEILAPSKKEPRWFSWWNGPKMKTPAEQFAWAVDAAGEADWKATAKACDALVREWPVSDEAPKAQQMLAFVLRDKLGLYEDAFAEFRYLLDYYPSRCDFDAIARELYETARLMRAKGKMWMFFRFANTVDVRRAYEAVVTRAPGADYAPAAMFAICELRVDEGQLEKAVQVCENLRNLYGRSPEAKSALWLEGDVRMKLLRTHEYNRLRCQDTIRFLSAALATSLDSAVKADFEKWRSEAVLLVEDEAFKAATFYDSKTRTRRSAIGAYERFLADYPASVHADEARVRLAALKEEK